MNKMLLVLVGNYTKPYHVFLYGPVTHTNYCLVYYYLAQKAAREYFSHVLEICFLMKYWSYQRCQLDIHEPIELVLETVRVRLYTILKILKILTA